MFTGLIHAQGALAAVQRRGSGCGLVLGGVPEAWGLALGASVAVDGICLTVEAFTDAGVQVYLSAETLACTTAGAWRIGRRVHLEPALRAGDPLGGHMVSGHVDGVGEVAERHTAGEDVVLTFRAPPPVAVALVPKGSIAVDGVSLTINAVTEATFVVNVIPHTQQQTHLGALAVGDAVNLEADTIAKQVAHLLAMHKEREAV